MASGKPGDTTRLNTDEPSVERHFEGVEVLEWNKQLTIRVFFVCLFIGFFTTIILMRLNLIMAFVLNSAIPPYLLSLFLLKTWTIFLDTIGILKNPITRQESVVMHSCLVGFFSIVYYGGFANYILGMSGLVAKQFEEGREGNNWTTIRLGWMIMYLFLVNFIGLFTMIPAAKTLILRLRLTYPSGCNASHFINVIHMPTEALHKRQQMWLLLKSCGASFCWGVFKWMYAGGPYCGLETFPAFGLQAAKNKFYTSMSPSLIAVGLICPNSVSISYLIGAFISCGIIWPIFQSKEGIWYPLGSSQALHGLYGYKILLTTAVLFGEGLFHASAILFKGFHDIYLKKKQKGFIVPQLHDHHSRHNTTDASMMANLSYDDRLRTKMFLKDHIPTPITIGGFLLTGTISAVVIPFIFPQVEPIHIAVAYIIAPVLNFCNAYGVGVSDFSFGPGYGRFSIFLFGGWIGLSQGGVLGSLVASSVVVAVMLPATDLIQNFKLAYMTLTSPRSLLIGQAIGTAMGCVFGPIIFYYYYNLPNFGNPDSEYPAYFGMTYRALAIAASQGSEGLPRHAILFSVIFFLISLALNIVKELSKSMNLGLHPYIPYPTAMVIPFYLSANFSFDVGFGSLILYVWNRVDRRSAGLYVPTLASGFFAGDSFWSLVSASLNNRVPPVCVKFFSREEYRNFENNLKKYPL